MTVDRNSMIDTSKHGFEPGSLKEALYDIWVGIVVGSAHVITMGRLFCSTQLSRLTGADENADKQITEQDVGQAQLKVVGVGYGRTGTYSLTMALEELGYPCLHTQHLYENDEIFSMWTNEIFNPSLEARHATLGKPDLRLIASKGFQAAADMPMALYFEQIHEQFPDCKFILTVRENSEVWFKSWDTLTKSILQPTQLGGMFIERVHQYSNYLRWLFALINKDDSYLTKPFPLPHQNKKAAIASYEEHNRRVRQVIPEDLLLEYNVKQGWEPLCQFLEVGNCPMTPFPKSNSARSVQVQSISAFVFPVTVICFLVFYLLAVIVKRATRKNVLQCITCKMNQLSNYLSQKSTGAK